VRPAPRHSHLRGLRWRVPVLWQDLFWFFGHPEVYILALPFFGIVTDILAVFSRKPIFGYRGMVFATISIGALSTSVWAHHMFTTGVVLLPSQLDVLPDRRADRDQVLQLDRHDVARFGQVRHPMLFAIGFLVTFLLGGVSGVLLASPPVDFATHDTYFVVAHSTAWSCHWSCRVRGVLLLVSEDDWTDAQRGAREGDVLAHVGGANVTFLPQYLLGLKGMPRRIAEYAASDGFTTLNRISSAGSVLLFFSVAIFLVNVLVSWWKPIPAGDNPWDASSLEWATSSPRPTTTSSRSRRSGPAPGLGLQPPEDRIIEHTKTRPEGSWPRAALARTCSKHQP